MVEIKDRFKEALKIQLQFIANSCDLYDQGHEVEAIRIATSVSTLLLDSGTQTSIATHLVGKDKRANLVLLSTNTTDMTGVHFFDLLSKFDPDDKQVPFLNEARIESTKPGQMKLKTWFDQSVIGLDADTPTKHYVINRFLIITTARNKDGGAHLDADIRDPAYILLRDGIEVMESGSGSKITTAQLHLVALRQIGYEVLESGLEKQLLG